MNVEEAWERYRATGHVDDRNVLVEHYLPIVDRVALRLGPFLAKHAEHEDLVAYGTIGLIDAVTKFDPSASTNFRGFAWKRIKGEIFDQLRRSDAVRRNLRLYARRIEHAHDELVARHQRPPTDHEIAAELGVSDTQLMEYLSYLAVTSLPVPLTAIEENGLTVGENLPAGVDVEEIVEVDQIRDSVVVAWNSLPARERTLLTLRYVVGLNLAEAGEVLGLGATRVSQLHGDALRQLRANMART